MVLTLPLVLPPHGGGLASSDASGAQTPLLGAWVLEAFGVKLVMTWWSAIFATIVVAFPLMYRTARGPSRASIRIWRTPDGRWDDPTAGYFGGYRCRYASRASLPAPCLRLPGLWGEYGATSMIAGYTPGRTATISTTVYQLWRTNDDAGAARWVLVNAAISAVFLLAVNLLETRQRQTRKEVR